MDHLAYQLARVIVWLRIVALASRWPFRPCIGDLVKHVPLLRRLLARDLGQRAIQPPRAREGRVMEDPKCTLTDGSPVTPDHREIDPRTGLQKDYVVLSAEERAKGFVRPVRVAYRHQTCGVVTRMARSIAETYARAPGFYRGTYCAGCRKHFPVGADGEFVWDGTAEKVGT